MYLGALVPLLPHGSQPSRAGQGPLPGGFGDQSGYPEAIPESIRRRDWLQPAKAGMAHQDGTAVPPLCAVTLIEMPRGLPAADLITGSHVRVTTVDALSTTIIHVHGL
jgi:hypothetical protein